MRIEFTSDQFLPYLPEQAQVNPGAYGFELAHWLSQQLAAQGVVTSYPLSEDWGWFLEYIEGEAEFMIGCGSQASEGDGYRVEPADRRITWHIFVKQQLSIVGRLKGHAAPEVTDRLVDLVVATLTRAGIPLAVHNS